MRHICGHKLDICINWNIPTTMQREVVGYNTLDWVGNYVP